MNCPKCGFEQPDGGLECVRCGIVFRRYKGPTAGAQPPVPPPPPPIQPGARLPLSSSEPFFAPPPPSPPPPPPPAEETGGTLYEGPLPVPQPAGTVYGGPPAFSTGRPVVHQSFEMGKVVTQIASVYFRNFIPFSILSVLALSPLVLLSAWVSGMGEEEGLAMLSIFIVPSLQLFFQPFATATITYGVIQQMRRRDISLGDCLRVGLGSLLPILGLAVVQGFAVGCVSMCCLLGLLLQTYWAVAVPAAVEERPGLGNSLSRSVYLTQGYRGSIFGVLFGLKAIEFGLMQAANFIWFAISAASTSSATAEPELNIGLRVLLGAVMAIFTTGLGGTVSAVLYYRLRSVKESLDLDQIASVFD